MNDRLDLQRLFPGTVSDHQTHTRVRQVTLESEGLERFLDQARAIDVQNLEYVPFMRFKLADMLLQACGEGLRATLNALVEDRRHGGIHDRPARLVGGSGRFREVRHGGGLFARPGQP